jgi:hypothetical protein
MINSFVATKKRDTQKEAFLSSHTALTNERRDRNGQTYKSISSMNLEASALSNFPRLVVRISSPYFHITRSKRNFKPLHQYKDEQTNQHRKVGRI